MPSDAGVARIPTGRFAGAADVFAAPADVFAAPADVFAAPADMVAAPRAAQSAKI
jgi:hypothetical protein